MMCQCDYNGVQFGGAVSTPDIFSVILVSEIFTVSRRNIVEISLTTKVLDGQADDELVFVK